MSIRPPLHIGTVIRNARAFNMQNWRGAVAPMDDILPTVAELFTLFKQRKVRPVLVSGIALLQFETYFAFFTIPFIQSAVEQIQLALVVYDWEQQEIVQWIN